MSSTAFEGGGAAFEGSVYENGARPVAGDPGTSFENVFEDEWLGSGEAPGYEGSFEQSAGPGFEVFEDEWSGGAPGYEGSYEGAYEGGNELSAGPGS